ncbi:hypothetical protein B4589_009510 [Halolamina sp. CBA1230]|uniref:hypothetical protein n=1 Tax=Halolamina sp. CBA1230 TaxID=1853690 RepID=UPI0009A146F7|nr:hypothetical protein [Halolamina sp. CBA1230]QKY20602.1 hypothetical protein B4589_009510 [Halolamina sp. CBA1230]
MSLRDTITEGIFDNLRTLIIVGVAYVVLANQGYAPPLTAPNIPAWWPFPVVIAGGAGLVAWVVGGKIADLVPSPDGHYVIAQEGGDEQGGEVWELNDAAWEQMNIVRGELYSWTKSPKDAHEVRIYNDSTNTSVANWRGTESAKVASEMLAQPTVKEAMENIRELRDEYERAAREGDYIKRNIGGMLRKLDKRRAKDYNAALQGVVAPSLNEGDSYEEIIDDILPDDVKPDHLTTDADSEESDPTEEHGSEMGFAVLEDGEEIDPMPEYDATEAATDGGTNR